MSFLRDNFKRSDGLDFTLIRGGRTHLLWKVTKNGKPVRFEVWQTFRIHGEERFYEVGQLDSESRSFRSLKPAEKYFNYKEQIINFTYK